MSDDLPAVADSQGTWVWRALPQLSQRQLVHFNQLVLGVLLVSAVVLALWPFTIHEGPRKGLASLLFWLPDAVVRSQSVWLVARGTLLAGAGLWLAGRGLPWSCWLTVAAYTTLWSLHVETTYQTAHIFHVPNTLLMFQALWYTADAPRLREARALGRFWRTPLVPRWLSLVSIAYLGLFHTAAGVSKLAASGWGWPSGVSLQLWVWLWGYPASPATQWVLASRTLARALQWATLVFETAGVLAVVPRLRPWIGAGLTLFYLGVLATFPYGFAFNAILTALYLLPCERWLLSAIIRRQQPLAAMPSSAGPRA
jgi:hypothetical protein